jgi:hypothetical protein
MTVQTDEGVGRIMGPRHRRMHGGFTSGIPAMGDQQVPMCMHRPGHSETACAVVVLVCDQVRAGYVEVATTTCSFHGVEGQTPLQEFTMHVAPYPCHSLDSTPLTPPPHTHTQHPLPQVRDLRRDLDIHVSGFDAPRPVKTFGQAGFDHLLLGTIKRAGYEAPTAIQAQALPAVLSGRDVLVSALGGGPLRQPFSCTTCVRDTLPVPLVVRP